MPDKSDIRYMSPILNSMELIRKTAMTIVTETSNAEYASVHLLNVSTSRIYLLVYTSIVLSTSPLKNFSSSSPVANAFENLVRNSFSTGFDASTATVLHALL